MTHESALDIAMFNSYDNNRPGVYFREVEFEILNIYKDQPFASLNEVCLMSNMNAGHQKEVQLSDIMEKLKIKEPDIELSCLLHLKCFLRKYFADYYILELDCTLANGVWFNFFAGELCINFNESINREDFAAYVLNSYGFKTQKILKSLKMEENRYCFIEKSGEVFSGIYEN